MSLLGLDLRVILPPGTLSRQCSSVVTLLPVLLTRCFMFENRKLFLVPIFLFIEGFRAQSKSWVTNSVETDITQTSEDETRHHHSFIICPRDTNVLTNITT